jgi:hypothetical protein
MSRIDQQRLITIRMERGLAVRELARDCGIEIAVSTDSKPPTIHLSPP